MLVKKRSKINYLNSHLKKLEKEEQINPKARRIKEVIKIREDINTVKNRITLENFNVTKFGSPKDR